MQSTTIALNRFGLGARPEDPRPDDPKGWLIQQLDHFEPRPQAFANVPTRAHVVEQLGDYLAAQQMAGRARRDIQPASMPINAALKQQPDPQEEELKKYLSQSIRQDYLAMNQARLDYALATPNPFVERLVHFWANHFSVSVEKLPVIGLAGLLEFEAIRPHVLGRFSNMLLAVEPHPAMLVYLVQAQA